MKTILTVDIGNTNTAFGLVRNGRVLGRASLPTGRLSEAGVARAARGLAGARGRVTAAFVCSVVSSANGRVRRGLRRALDVPVYFAGQDVAVPIKNRYRRPRQVGQDRLVGAYAAMKLFGPGLVVVDFGTAITFDVVSRKGEYLGGLITPGFKMMQEALEKRTALLPYVELARPTELIGRDTKSSIRGGLIYGVAGLCDGILGRLLTGRRRGFRVVVTGGDAHLVRPLARRLDHVVEDLIHKGLFHLATMKKRPR